MPALFKLAMTIVVLGWAHTATADPDTLTRPLGGQADLCYRETLAATAGKAQDQLSTVACARALRQMPLSRDDRSIVLYNRGLIQRAQGRDAAARASFERAVALSRSVDMRNLALAQQAHKLGDYAVAVQQYQLILESPIAADDVRKYRETIKRNRATAMLSLKQDAGINSVASTTSTTE